jgi:hypothetical protein
LNCVIVAAAAKLIAPQWNIWMDVPFRAVKGTHFQALLGSGPPGLHCSRSNLRPSVLPSVFAAIRISPYCVAAPEALR